LNEKVLQTLEYDKIVRKLAEHAATPLGKERAEQLRPSPDFETVKRELKTTDEAATVLRLKGGAPFGGIRDVRAQLQRAKIGGTLGPAELLDIADTIAGGRKLKKFLLAVHENEPVPILADLCVSVSENRNVEEQIRACIDDNAEIVDQASPELARIRRELRLNESRVREKLEQTIRNPAVQKMLQDQLITIRNGRYVIPVKQEYRAHFGGIVHDQSASGATLFIEPEAIVAINNKLRELKLKEEKEIEKILRQLSGAVAEAVDELLVSAKALGEIDYIFAKAELAREWKAVLPAMNDRGFLKIKKGRHPLIPAESIVPLDVELGDPYTTMIITGPNTGGKTVTLKTIGLFSLMAMSGLFVPAEDGTELCMFDNVFADIGDEQSIEQNLSTFSSHLTNIIRILREMTPKSLVLFDELGAGTDPSEGSALAVAILEYVHRLGCRTVATTHYGELKAYAYERKGIVNASMEFNVQTLSPTYRLLVGVPGRSNAFAIAERLGLPKPIIDMARGRVGEDDRRVETMLASLEQNRLSAEAEREDAERLRREADELRRQLEEERRRFMEQRDKLLAKAEQEAAEIVAKARREAEEVIRELRRMMAEERGAVKEHQLIEAKRRLDQAVPERNDRRDTSRPKRQTAKIEPGDEVKVLHLNQKGHVLELVGDREALVQIGIIKMKVNVADLEPVSPSAVKQPVQHVTTVKRSRDADVRTELDLRGVNVEEAVIETDRFLDECFLSGLGQVYLIHGKGTGALRAGLHEYLRKHKHVKSFRLGHYGEGGSGVTVVDLR